MFRCAFTVAVAAALLVVMPARAERADPMHSPQCAAAAKALAAAEQEAGTPGAAEADRASRLRALQALRRRAAVACLGGENTPAVSAPGSPRAASAGERARAPLSPDRVQVPPLSEDPVPAPPLSADRVPVPLQSADRVPVPLQSADRVPVPPPRLPVFRPPPPRVAPPPAAAQPGRPWVASCDAYGCWGGDGFYYPRQSGPLLVGPQGVCAQAGPGQPCR